jgi:uncharacterized membrane protein YheB (UPF0754 family)
VLQKLLAALTDPGFWAYANIPFTAAFIGWFTNWVAIGMTFRPLEFRGVRPFGWHLGWQGIIPSKAVKMAAIFVDRTMFRLGTLREVFHAMEPGAIAEHVARVVDARLPQYVDEVMFLSNAQIWGRLPEPARQAVIGRVRARVPDTVHRLLAEIGERIEELLDLKELLVRRLDTDKVLLNRLFQESGAAEFKFIIRSGAWFGFLFGLGQLTVWLLYPEPWVLPVGGAIVGYATNWFALEIIFRPLAPRRIGPWTVQGLFLKRQAEVSAVWCRLVTTEILTVQQLVYGMLYGSRAERTAELIRGHVQPLADEALAGYRLAAGLALGESRLAGIREAVGDKALELSPDPFDHWPFNRDRAEVIERVLLERMVHLPPAEFQDLLRPCFQEDEMKLILAGAALGFLAGLLQILFV